MERNGRAAAGGLVTVTLALALAETAAPGTTGSTVLPAALALAAATPSVLASRASRSGWVIDRAPVTAAADRVGAREGRKERS